jgi:hypothetical protein
MNDLKPKKTCLICNINEDYVCFECEDIFVKKNYPNGIKTQKSI